VDYSGYSSNTFDPRYFERSPSASSLVPPVNVSSERFIMALTGKNLAFGYVLDGQTHNLVLSHRSGWGASFGISDQYNESEGSTTYQGQLTDASALEVSRRDLRFALGWSGSRASGRRFELGLGADFVNTQYSATQIFQGVDSTFYSSAEWKSEPGLGYEVRLRTISPGSGFQGVLRLAYEDLQPDVTSGPAATWIRRYALSELGWRIPLKELDDLVAGVVLEWSHDTIAGLAINGGPTLGSQEVENTRYYGHVFASGERRIVQRLIGRAGVRGSASFERTASSESTGLPGYTRIRSVKNSEGAIATPEIFLGAGWSWKSFTLDGRLREYIDLTNPVSQWSVSYVW
jgi:hypothetical protein